MNAKPRLLFLVTDDRCAERTTATATLAWLAAQAGSEFDAYLEQGAQYRPAGGPISVPFTGNWHAEQFYFIANFFDITFCSISTAPEVQYRREALAMGANVLTVRGPEEIAECYLDVFGSLGQALPATVVV